MKILSSFDLIKKAKLLAQEKSKYGAEKVFIIEKSRVFYRLQVLFPSFAVLAGSIMGLILRLFAIMPERNVIFNRGYRILLAVVVVSVALPLLKKYFDYHMDFLIVTPENIISYDQEGFLERNIVSLNMRNIKTVTVRKMGLMNSLFNEGKIEILAEGDIAGRLVVEYVTNPEHTKNKIKDILNNTFTLQIPTSNFACV